MQETKHLHLLLISILFVYFLIKWQQYESIYAICSSTSLHLVYWRVY